MWCLSFRKMRLCKKIPWRRVKALVPVFIVASLLLVILSYFFDDQWQQKYNHRSSAGRFYHLANLRLPWLYTERILDPENCPCGQSYKPSANIYTYSLPDVTNYTLDKDREYIIPDPRKDIVKRKTSGSFDKEPVQVILVPFSHADPGYGNTMEGYYSSSTKRTLDNMVMKLQEYRNMTFQWVETVFLERWFRDIDQATKTAVRALIERGQLEIVLGGWVMPDEASTHYGAVVDQLIEGHQWLQENLGVRPVTAWVNDPFGYSSTLPYLWQRAGLQNLVILRIHQAIKATLMKNQELEFQWRPFWKDKSDRDILCNIMPYRNYWLNNVCGPDQEICGQFNYLHVHGHNSKAQTVTDRNLPDLAKTLYEQYKFTAGFYRYKTLYIGMGEDFSYPEPQSWDDMYRNYEKLIHYINSRKDWNMNVKFGTLTEYFNHVRNMEAKYGKELDSSFPVLSGDFFPYSDWDDAYWTGYFTTRPALKRFGREIEPLLRMADIFNVFTSQFIKAKDTAYDSKNDIARKLMFTRRELGMFLHHDGITGTSLSFVVADFKSRLEQAYENVLSAMKMILMSLISNGQSSSDKNLDYAYEKKMTTDILKLRTIKSTKNGLKLVVVNPAERERKEIVSIGTDSADIVVKCSEDTALPVQLSSSTPGLSSSRGKVLSFPAKFPPFGIRTYTIIQSDKGSSAVSEYKDPGRSEVKIIVLENQHFTVDFDSNSGLIQRIVDTQNSHAMTVSAQFFSYQSGKSGAYLFNAAGKAVPLRFTSPKVKVLRGPLWSEVCLESIGLLHCVRVYNTSEMAGKGVFIRNEVNLEKLGLSNSELILRFVTNLKNKNIFFTDQNGFQLLGRKTYPKRLIESNYYPITNMALLEDESMRLTLHSAQPHGVASLKEGWLEVMLDRTMTRDDGRGLGIGVLDREPFLAEFVIQLEKKNRDRAINEFRFMSVSRGANIVSENLKNPVQIFAYSDIPAQGDLTFSPLDNPLPCDISVVGLRNLVSNDLKYSGTSLVAHRKSFDCNYDTSFLSEICPVSPQKLTLRSVFKDFRGDFEETTLSHLQTFQALNQDSDISPDCNELRSFLVKFP